MLVWLHSEMFQSLHKFTPMCYDHLPNLPQARSEPAESRATPLPSWLNSPETPLEGDGSIVQE